MNAIERNVTWAGYALFSAAVVALSSHASGQSALYEIEGVAAGDGLGQSVEIVGDMNGDGFADVLVGAWKDDIGGLDAGSVRAVSGKNGATLLLLTGDAPGDQLGFASSGAGDINADGFADIVAGANAATVAGMSSAGMVKIVSGLTGQVLYQAVGDNPADLFGYSTAPVGDVNGDGFADVAVGAIFDDDPSKVNCGSVTVISGFDGAVLFRYAGFSANDNIGYSVSGGDVNADGFSDILAGAPGADPNGSGSGSAYAFDGVTGAVLRTVHGDSGSDALGRAVSASSDVDQDGHADLIVGAPSDDVGFTNNGSVRVVSGATGAQLYLFAGRAALDRFGESVRGVGDVDGDGYGDVLVGTPGDDTFGSGAGSATFLSGRDGFMAYILPGANSGDAFGTSVGGGGDVDGDGAPDIVVGEIGADFGGPSSGAARVMSMLPRGIKPIGSGTPGCLGSERLNANSSPVAGNQDFCIIGSPGPAGAIGILVFGDTADPVGNDVLHIGATLHIALAPIAGFVAGLPSFRDPKGALIAHVAIPPNPALVGVKAAVQNITVWPTPCPGLGPLKASTSQGIWITVQ